MCWGNRERKYQSRLVGPGYKEIHKERENHELVQNVNTLRLQAEKVINKSHQADRGEEDS